METQFVRLGKGGKYIVNISAVSHIEIFESGTVAIRVGPSNERISLEPHEGVAVIEFFTASQRLIDLTRAPA
jgi:hypothetical protein